MTGKDGKPGDVPQAVQSFKAMTENIDKRSQETLNSVKQLADNLDKRTADLSVGLLRFTGSGLREWERLAVDGRRAANNSARGAQLPAQPTRVIWGGALGSDGSSSGEAAATPRRRRR